MGKTPLGKTLYARQLNLRAVLPLTKR
ncbi:protein of unknown function [Paraburkholderia kururiensis]